MGHGSLLCGPHEPVGAEDHGSAPWEDGIIMTTASGLGYRWQEALEHGLDGAGFEGHLQGPGQPVACMLVAMPSDDVGRAPHLSRAFLRKAPLDVGPGQVHHDAPFLHRFVAPDPKIGQAQGQLEVQIVDFARPTPAIPLQGLGGGQGEIRTGEVRRAIVPGMPFRGKDADIEGQILKRPVRSRTK